MKYAIVPVEPTEDMWGGLARVLVQWSFFSRPSGKYLYEHLARLNIEAPEWLSKEVPNTDHCPPKGTVAVCIYKSMLTAAPTPLEDDELVERVARAIWDSSYPSGTTWGDWDKHCERNKNKYDDRDSARRLARAAIAALKGA